MQSATPFHTLHGIKETAESRKDVVIDGAQEISAPHLFWGQGVRIRRREKSCKYDESTMSLLSHRVTCSKSLGLKFLLNSI